MPGVQEQVRQQRTTDDRRSVRRHRTQPAPEARLRLIAGPAEKILDRMRESGLAFRVQAEVETGDFRHSADADAVAQSRDRDLVGFVHHGRYRGAAVVDDRSGDRIALDLSLIHI